MRRKISSVPTSLLLTGAFWPVVATATDDEFAELDRNEDGYLSVAEAGKKSGLMERFTQLDTDADGQLSKEEWDAGAPDTREDTR